MEQEVIIILFLNQIFPNAKKNCRALLSFKFIYTICSIGNDAIPSENNPNETFKKEVIQPVHKLINEQPDPNAVSNENTEQYTQSTEKQSKSSWKSLCEKSLEMARILNSFSVKMAKMLLSTLDKIHRFVPRAFNEMPIHPENGTK